MCIRDSIERDIHRCKLVRELIGKDNKLMVDSNQVWSVNETIEYINQLKQFDIMFYEEPTSPDDIIGFRKIKDAHPDIKLATGEMIQNKVIFSNKLSYQLTSMNISFNILTNFHFKVRPTFF